MPRDASRTKRATLKDVAREAGVSVQTASHVMADNRTVRLPEPTRERVRKAAKAVGYVPNQHARAIRTGKTNVIAVWMPLDRPIVSLLRTLMELSECARETGHELMVVGLDRESALKPGGRLPTPWTVDGIVSVEAGKALGEFRKDPQNDHVPLCILGYESYANADSVAWNVLEATRAATESLIARGCKHIVHLTLDWILEGFPNERRRKGYAEAMEAAGLRPRYVAAKEERSAGAQVALQELMDSGFVPDGVIAATDALAIGSIKALQAAGHNVPGDCPVWGFGDWPEGEDFYVPVSTIRQPLRKVCRQAWNWLVDRIDDPSQPARNAVLDMELVERTSTNGT